MAKAPFVTVFHFHEYRYGSDQPVLSKFKAARETIESVFKRDVVEGTGESVPASELDGEGRYQRRATGWGDLD